MRDGIASWRVNVARGIAVAADALQLLLFPAFGPGVLSPLDDALDVVVAAAMFGLVGWHWSFAPAFAIELIPTVDAAPTWTVAVLLATRDRDLVGRPRLAAGK
jgi:hypothetical protein